MEGTEVWLGVKMWWGLFEEQGVEQQSCQASEGEGVPF